MSGLLHLVEAATALTQLGPAASALPPLSVSQTSVSTSSTMSVSPTPLSTATAAPAYVVPTYQRRLSTHAISDDDDTSLQACNKIAALRENHLQALRAAASDAGATFPVATPSVQGGSNSMNLLASQAIQPQQLTTTIPQGPGSTSVSVVGSSAPAAATREMFPLRLHSLLSDPTVRDVISWLPHGKSFVILRPDVFASHVLPMYFAPEGSNSLNSTRITKAQKGVHKYPSFTRKLNRWGFRQISRGADAGAFCHEMFQRDDVELCRGMVCQKSRKSSSKSNKGQQGIDCDMMSVSSASTMGTKQSSVASYEMKRPYSSTVTVSTAGATSNKSLPFKKRKSGHHATDNYMMNDIPSTISHRTNVKMSNTWSASSMTESDYVSESGGSVCSAPKTVPKAQVNVVNAAATKLSAEAAAREALARHFHEQHRAFALASLMENSRLAMEAAGLKNQVVVAAAAAAASSSVALTQPSQPQIATCLPVVGAVTTHSPNVFAATTAVVQKNALAANTSSAVSTVDMAKSQLYKAYLQALSSNNLKCP